MNELKDYHHLSHRSQMSRYDHEQGFSDEQKEPAIIISQPQVCYGSTNILDKKKARARVHEPKTKLKYLINEQSTRLSIQNVIADKQFQNRNSVSKSLQIRKKDLGKTVNTVLQPIIKSKRTLIGQNLTIPSYAIQDLKQIKQSKQSDGCIISFEAAKQINTHGQLKKIAPLFENRSFINSKYNLLLKQRLKDSFIMPKRKAEEVQGTKLKFNNQVQCGNLQLAIQVAEFQYELFLKIDTNTHGHQNWFFFEATSQLNEMNNFTFHICNMKRDFRLIEKGQKIFVKEQNKDQKWQPTGTNISICENTNQKIARGRIFKLSFTLALKPNAKYQIAMLPSYSYSDMLNMVENIEVQFKKYVEVDLLGYSLTGLAMPLITITNKEAKPEGKKVVLISCRVHPGETVASYVVEGLIKKLIDDSSKGVSEMLKNTIFKIIPMLNPDGVVFGNFRTNYLGIDLNRAFHSDDQILNPQIWSLKNLGRQLKSQFGQNFALFLDLHGHSSQKNIFTYGPNFQYNDPNFYIARLLPKVLATRSKYFKYNSCTFKLEEHKLHTARGFFLNQLNVMTYTVQSSYSLYDDFDGAQKLMRVEDWLNFGMDLAEGLEASFRIKQANSIRSNRQLRNILNANENEEIALMKKIKSDIKKQVKSRQKIILQKEENEDTDGESEAEDLTEQERKDTQKKVLQFSIPSFSLPKVIKPAILYPTVTPRLFEVNEQKDESNFKILYTKRSKYNTLRMMNANSMYANYLKNLEQLQKFKPSARNIKLQKKLQL